MSEYQYYEFLAVDRPLTGRETRELRAVSSRAVITATRFTNHYEWGSFKGDPRAWMERYFDAFLYFANWGTRELMLACPGACSTRPWRNGTAAGRPSARVKGEHVILEFSSEDEGSDWFEEERTELSSLVPLRAEIASGDACPLPGLVLCAQAGELDDGDGSLLVRPGSAGSARRSRPSSVHGVDRDLLEAAAGQPEAEETPGRRRGALGLGLAEAEKTASLVRLIRGDEPHLRAELVRASATPVLCPRPARQPDGVPSASSSRPPSARAEERRRREADAPPARGRREREAAELVSAISPRWPDVRGAWVRWRR